MYSSGQTDTDLHTIRSRSLEVARELGYATNVDLPLMEGGVLRPCEVILDRILCLHVTVSAAYGMPKNLGLQWIHNERLDRGLSESESQFLRSGDAILNALKLQVESIWALAYVLMLVGDLDVGMSCDQQLVRLMPNLKTGEKSAEFRKKSRLRGTKYILQKLDTAYCLHWSIRDAELRGLPAPGRVEPYVIIERRRALEWCMSDDDWDDVNMDT